MLHGWIMLLYTNKANNVFAFVGNLFALKAITASRTAETATDVYNCQYLFPCFSRKACHWPFDWHYSQGPTAESLPSSAHERSAATSQETIAYRQGRA
ncbi:hypothetical protein D3C84_743880 [compost metagenome]